MFRIEALATGDADLEEIEREIQAVLDEFVRDGPTEAELARAKAQREARFLRRMESLFARAEAINAYHHYFGVADGFQAAGVEAPGESINAVLIRPADPPEASRRLPSPDATQSPSTPNQPAAPESPRRKPGRPRKHVNHEPESHQS